MSHPAPVFDVEGRRIAPADVARAMRINIGAGCLGMMYFAMAVGMPLTMFMEATGATGTLIGLATTARLLALAAQIPGAFFAERLSSRKRFWAPVTIIHRALWYGMAFLALWAKPGEPWLGICVLVIVTLSDVLGNLGAAAWFSWMTDLIPEKTAGRFWGFRQSVVTAASLAGMGFAGWLLDLFRDPRTGTVAMGGFAVAFGLAATLGVADIVVHLKVREPRPAPRDPGQTLLERLLAPLRMRDFRQLILAMGAWNCAAALVGTFGIVYLKKDFGATYSHLAWLAIAGSLGSVASSAFLGRLVDQLGARTLCALLFLVAPLPSLVWFFLEPGILIRIGQTHVPQAVLALLAANFLSGSLFAGLGLCQMRLLGQLSEPSGRTMAMAVHWCLVGLIAALGPLVGGAVMDWFEAHPARWSLPNGVKGSYYHVITAGFIAMVWCVALPLLIAIRKRNEEMHLGQAVSQIVFSNPLQTVRNFYNLHVMAGQASSARRALAARKLGQTKTGIAVPELIQKLDDPSLDVREGAVEALGAIGGEPAVRALVRKLDDPSEDLAPAVVRALRLAGDPAAGDALLQKLVSADRATVIEAVRALGALGEQRAAAPLLEIVRTSADAPLVAAAGDALAALGELEATWRIVEQMRRLPNRMLKRALGIATADILGERDAFYKLLVMDAEKPGSAAAEIAKRLGKALRGEPDLHTLTTEVEAWLTEGPVADAATRLRDAGCAIAASRFDLDPNSDAHAIMRELFETDRRAAIAVWHLLVIAEPWMIEGNDTRDRADLLLGGYVLTCLAR